MFKITGKKNGIVWDKAANKPLAKFKDGAFETEDKAVNKKLTELGYESKEIKDSSPEKSE